MSLKQRLRDPGIVVSALVHVGALAATLIAFSQTEKFDDLQETVPVEVVTDNQFNQIMKGDKAGKDIHPDTVATVEETAPQPVEQPTPPTPDKSQSAAPPPPPPPMPPERPVEQPKPAPAPPPPPVAVLPPPRPEPPAPAPPVPIPPVRDVEAEPVAPPKPDPKPVPRPRPAPTPPVAPRPPIAKLPEPKPAPRPRPADKPKVDQLAKLMDTLPTETTTPVPQPVSKAREAAPNETKKFDLTDITKLLGSSSTSTSTAPAARASANPQPSRVASLGSPTASATKMSPSFWAGLDGVMEDQYRQCWSYLGLNSAVKYVPQVRVVYAANGALEADPVLINPPSDPALRSLAESALRAVRKCNPLKIPDQYAPYYDQWKGRVLRFDPEEMAG